MSVVSSSSPLRAVLIAGFVAGLFDIVAAFTVYGVLGIGPVRILQSISSGLYGRAAFQGGTGTAAQGLLLQFFIATFAASAYYAASRRLPVLVRRPVEFGAIYGIVVYFFMNFVVVPLSAVPRGPFNVKIAAVIVIVHIACVGVPIAWILNRHLVVAAKECKDVDLQPRRVDVCR